MNLFFINKKISNLAEDKSDFLLEVKNSLLLNQDIKEVFNLKKADAILIQEKKQTFKNFNYIKELESDPIISAYPEKVFTLNTDDCATGLLRGLYTSLPSKRYNPNLYTVVPYPPNDFLNKFVFSEEHRDVNPSYLASWYGNIRSSFIRQELFNMFAFKEGFLVMKSRSWVKYPHEEQNEYVNLMLSSKFSLCPPGWAPATLRIYESMALGRCPVVIADGFVPPKGPDWSSFALFLPERKLKHLHSFLFQYEHLAEKLGNNAFEAWKKYFSFPVIAKYYAESLLSLIRSTPKTHKVAEIARWHSFSLHWKNKWTTPQRIVNKILRSKTIIGSLLLLCQLIFSIQI